MDPARLRLAPIDGANWMVACGLDAGEGQRFVAPNAYSLAEAAYDPDTDLVPLLALVDDEPVGFAMYGLDLVHDELWLVRLMIRGSLQGRGFGGRLLEEVLVRARAHHPGRAIRLGVAPGNEVAERLYRRTGFVPTGETIDGERVFELPAPSVAAVRPPAGLEALLCDLDGVLRRWEGRAPEARFGLPEGAIAAAVLAPERALDAITGRVDDAAWRAAAAAELAARFPEADATAAVAAWSAVSGRVDPEALALVAGCRAAGVRVVLVTNATTRLPEDLARLGLADAFDAVVNSAEVGAAKPDPALFRAALAAAGAAPAACLFVDDTPGHVAAARALGIPAVLVDDAASLRAAIEGDGRD